VLKATSFISPTVCPLSLDPLRIIQSVPFTHNTQTLCQLVPHAKKFVFSNPNQKPPAQSSVDAPVPCATCRGHSHFLRSFSISPFGANSRAARLLHSSPFRYLFIPFHSAARHSITPFRNPHGSISSIHRWL
jgi:hypothetical protein